MSAEDGTKPWDAPDPSQLRITSSPADRRQKPVAPRQGESGGQEEEVPPARPGHLGPRLPAVPPVAPRAPVSFEQPSDLDPASAPIRHPRRPAPGSTDQAEPTAAVSAAARVGPQVDVRSTSSFVSPTVKVTEPVASGSEVAIDAPPIPRPRYPFGAPPPAVVDTRAPSPRVSLGPGASSWHELDVEAPEPESEPAQAPVVPWAANAGVAVGVGALLLVGLSVGWVVGQAAFLAAFGDKDSSTEVTVEPQVPAFRGIELDGAPGADGDLPGSDVDPEAEGGPRPSLLPVSPDRRPSASTRRGWEPTAPVSTREVPPVVPERRAEPGVRLPEQPPQTLPDSPEDEPEVTPLDPLSELEYGEDHPDDSEDPGFEEALDPLDETDVFEDEEGLEADPSIAPSLDPAEEPSVAPANAAPPVEEQDAEPSVEPPSRSDAPDAANAPVQRVEPIPAEAGDPR